MAWTVTVNGVTYTDSDMANYGYLAKWPALLQDAVTDFAAKQSATNGYMNSAMSAAQDASASKNAAAASAASALNAPGTGSKSLTIQSGKVIPPGCKILIARASDPAGVWMYGTQTAYDAVTGVITVAVSRAAGSGSVSDWSVSVCGLEGIQGLSGAGLTPWASQSANYTAVSGDRILASTAGGSWSLMLPSAPSAGDNVQIMDADGAFSAHPLTIDPNGETICGASGGRL